MKPSARVRRSLGYHVAIALRTAETIFLCQTKSAGEVPTKTTFLREEFHLLGNAPVATLRSLQLLPIQCFILDENFHLYMKSSTPTSIQSCSRVPEF